MLDSIPIGKFALSLRDSKVSRLFAAVSMLILLLVMFRVLSKSFWSSLWTAMKIGFTALRFNIEVNTMQGKYPRLIQKTEILLQKSHIEPFNGVASRGRSIVRRFVHYDPTMSYKGILKMSCMREY